MAIRKFARVIPGLEIVRIPPVHHGIVTRCTRRPLRNEKDVTNLRGGTEDIAAIEEILEAQQRSVVRRLHLDVVPVDVGPIEIGIEDGEELRAFHHGPDAGGSRDIAKGSEPIVEIDFSRGGERFADRVWFHNRHCEEIEEEVIGRRDVGREMSARPPAARAEARMINAAGGIGTEEQGLPGLGPIRGTGEQGRFRGLHAAGQ